MSCLRPRHIAARSYGRVVDQARIVRFNSQYSGTASQNLGCACFDMGTRGKCRGPIAADAKGRCQLDYEHSDLKQHVSCAHPCPKLRDLAQLVNRHNAVGNLHYLEEKPHQGPKLSCSFLAAPQGFEPRYADPESAVLPLNEGAKRASGGSACSCVAWPYRCAHKANLFILRGIPGRGQRDQG